VVLIWPGWTILAFSILIGISLVILGVMGVVRAFTFRKEAKVAASAETPARTAMGDVTPASEEPEVPTEVAQAARLWAGDKKFTEPEFAGWANNFTWKVLQRS